MARKRAHHKVGKKRHGKGKVRIEPTLKHEGLKMGHKRTSRKRSAKR